MSVINFNQIKHRKFCVATSNVMLIRALTKTRESVKVCDDWKDLKHICNNFAKSQIDVESATFTVDSFRSI